MRLTFPLSLKSLDEAGRFAGYASVFDVVDSQNDVIRRGAFINSIRVRKSEIKLLWQHQFHEPVGIITQLFEDARGLFIEGRLLMNVARALEAHALLKSGAVKGLSIGYTPVRSHTDPHTGARIIEEVDLWEVSLVTFPANAEALVTVVKTSSPDFAQQSIGGPRKMDDPIVACGNSGHSEWRSAISAGQLIEFADAVSRARHHLR